LPQPPPGGGGGWWPAQPWLLPGPPPGSPTAIGATVAASTKTAKTAAPTRLILLMPALLPPPSAILDRKRLVFKRCSRVSIDEKAPRRSGTRPTVRPQRSPIRARIAFDVIARLNTRDLVSVRIDELHTKPSRSRRPRKEEGERASGALVEGDLAAICIDPGASRKNRLAGLEGGWTRRSAGEIEFTHPLHPLGSVPRGRGILVARPR
jgi:hypothetical protein